MTDYILKKVDNDFWKEIKKLVANKETTIKALIIQLLKNELIKAKNTRNGENT